jgi:hypothetical protein
MEFSRPFGAFVASMLREIQPSAHLLEFAEGPPDHYTVRIEVPGEVGKTLILTRRLVEDATVRPAALRSLRLLLRSEVLQQRARRLLSDSSAICAQTDTTVIGTCGVCGEPVTMAERILVRRANMLHARCTQVNSA